MQIALNLVGISHLIHNERWPISRSYLDCYQNTLEFRDMLKKMGDVDTFLTTYDIIDNGDSQHSALPKLAPKIQYHRDNLYKIYKPIDYTFLSFANSHQIDTFVKSLQLIKKSSKFYDLVVVSRFDTMLNIDEFKQLSIVLHRFNFLCREGDFWESHEFVNDCFYVFPGWMIDAVIHAAALLKINPPRPGLMDMHGLFTPLRNIVGDNNLNFLTDERHLSSGNKFYKLIRR